MASGIQTSVATRLEVLFLSIIPKSISLVDVSPEWFRLILIEVHTFGSFDLEVHLFHKSADGKFAVIAIFFNESHDDDAESPFLKQVAITCLSAIYYKTSGKCSSRRECSMSHSACARY